MRRPVLPNPLHVVRLSGRDAWKGCQKYLTSHLPSSNQMAASWQSWLVSPVSRRILLCPWRQRDKDGWSGTRWYAQVSLVRCPIVCLIALAPFNAPHRKASTYAIEDVWLGAFATTWTWVSAATAEKLPFTFAVARGWTRDNHRLSWSATCRQTWLSRERERERETKRERERERARERERERERERIDSYTITLIRWCFHCFLGLRIF